MNKNLPVLINDKGNYIFPGFSDEINVGVERSKKTISISKEKFKSEILLVISLSEKTKTANMIDQIHHIGVLCELEIKKKMPNSFIVKLSAKQKIKLTNLKMKDDVCFADYQIIKDEALTKTKRQDLLEKVVQLLEKVGQKVPDKAKAQFATDENVSEFFYMILQNYFENVDNFKQKALETNDLWERYKLINKYVKFEPLKNVDFSKVVDQTINRRVNKRFSKQQREFLLREKLKAIREELGETDPKEKEISNYLNRINEEPFPQHIKDKLNEEIIRYQKLPSFSGESGMIKSYIDTVINLPWYQATKDTNNLKTARKVLDANHFGLKKVKERIIEHLATNFFTKKQAGQIICFVGPPGVGKTTLGVSIAQAMKKKYVRIALGGIKDEAEIRGHRRTYLGSMPGKIIQALKKAKTFNPVMLIDEIDKLGSDHRGDPASAMLEVLDPGQNKHFVDHYVEEHYDLSKVMFIATANFEWNIPLALYDRMEIVRLSSYTEFEKIQIAEKYLAPQILKQLGLTKKQIVFETISLKEIIKFYTRESGVRELQRLIMKICRKVIVKILTKSNFQIILSEKNISTFLGQRIFEYTEKSKKSDVGTVTGLAYTQFGGDILPIETTFFNGKGRLILTGKLGKVMKESAEIAYDYIKSNAKSFGIDFNIFTSNDVHIHVPEGATPKDGPSAGITITSALISLFKKQKVSNHLAMTGEITLRGKVLPIGGLREKTISATRSGIKKIFIPKGNKKDLKNLPKEVIAALKIIPVNDYQQIFDDLFTNNE